MSFINGLVVIIAIFAVIFFMAIYSSTLWERTPEGRNLMLFPVSFILLGLSSISRRGDILPSIAEDTLSIIAWLLVSALMVQRGIHVLRAQKNMEKCEQTGRNLESESKQEEGEE